MHRTLTGPVAIVALATAALSGCGGDDDGASSTTGRSTETTAVSSPKTSSADTATGSTVPAADATEADYLAAIERSLSSGEEGGLKTTAEQAACMAPKWLATIGVDRIKEKGIAPSQIGDDVNDDGSALSDLGLTEDEGTPSTTRSVSATSTSSRTSSSSSRRTRAPRSPHAWPMP